MEHQKKQDSVDRYKDFDFYTKGDEEPLKVVNRGMTNDGTYD